MENYINCRQCHNVFFADEEWKKICLKCWIKQKKRAEESRYQNSYRPPPPKHNASNELKEMLPLLIRLCHPDRHNNSESSTKVTQWLLKQRNNP
jgi:ribosomal protein L40E